MLSHVRLLGFFPMMDGHIMDMILLFSKCLLSTYKCYDPEQTIKLLDFFLINTASSQDLDEDLNELMCIYSTGFA